VTGSITTSFPNRVTRCAALRDKRRRSEGERFGLTSFTKPPKGVRRKANRRRNAVVKLARRRNRGS
jgi:hypothetical protein